MKAPTIRRPSELFIYNKLDAAQRRLYEEQGYLRLGRLLTPEAIEKMRSECMQSWSADKN